MDRCMAEKAYFSLLFAFMRWSWFRICFRMRRFSRGDLQQLVLCQESPGSLPGSACYGDQAQASSGAGGAGVGQVLGLADVDIHILAEAV